MRSALERPWRPSPRDVQVQLPAATHLAAALARFPTQLQADGRSPHTVAQYARGTCEGSTVGSWPSIYPTTSPVRSRARRAASAADDTVAGLWDHALCAFLLGTGAGPVSARALGVGEFDLSAGTATLRELMGGESMTP